MSKNSESCASVQHRLADEGLHLLSKDAELQLHIGECEECFAFMGALETVDRELDNSVDHVPAESLVTATLEKIRALPVPSPEVLPARSSKRREQRAGAIELIGIFAVLRWVRLAMLRPRFVGAALAACVILLGLRVHNGPMLSMKQISDYEVDGQANEATNGVSGGASFSTADDSYGFRRAPRDLRQEPAPAQAPAGAPAPVQEQYNDLILAFKNDLDEEKAQRKQLEQRIFDAEKKNELHRYNTKAGSDRLAAKVSGVTREIDAEAGAIVPPAPQDAAPSAIATNPSGVGAAHVPGFFSEPSFEDEPLLAKDSPARKYLSDEGFADLLEHGVRTGGQESDEIAEGAAEGAAKSEAGKKRSDKISADLADAKEKSSVPSSSTPRERREYLDRALSLRSLPPPEVTDRLLNSESTSTASTASSGLSAPLGSRRVTANPEAASFRSLDGLEFKDPSGYWHNSYVPGDPAIQVLRKTLEKGRALQQSDSELTLHQLAQYPYQPFDVPANAAMGLQVSADRTGLTGPGRMLVQVGLQGTDRNAGRRAALNVAIVLDLSAPPSEAMQSQIRDLITAFSEAKDVGDQYRLYIANTGAEIGSEDFRHGPLTLALRAAFAAPALEDSVNGQLRQSYLNALAAVRGSDDPNAPLGSSSVIFVSDRTASGPAQFSETARTAAVDGVQTSAILLNQNASTGLEEWESVALQGQGSRYVVTPGEDPKQVVAKEIASVSRTIARAVRLRIRLAPGVKLVNVLGSYRLDENRAQQVRDAEKSVDRRIARSMGIESDRGDDEEGIQIVIPAFFAGDSHVILLDVVAPDAGAIADVRIRYKDLVHLKNAVATANLSVGRSVSALGPLEQNVLKNFLVRTLSDALAAGGSSILAGGPLPDLAQYRTRYEEVLALAPALRRDTEILADQELLARYEQIRQIVPGMQASTRQLVAESLQVAGVRKLLPIETDQSERK